jgi:hypothetical protein
LGGALTIPKTGQIGAVPETLSLRIEIIVLTNLKSVLLYQFMAREGALKGLATDEAKEPGSKKQGLEMNQQSRNLMSNEPHRDLRCVLHRQGSHLDPSQAAAPACEANPADLQVG